MRVAMVSEHASPLAALGDVDAGGQNVHVGELSAALAHHGHDVTVYTRRTDPSSAERIRTERGFTVVQVPAGPARPLPKDDLYRYMGEFGQRLGTALAVAPPDLVHAHFWMSGLASVLAARQVGVPVVQTFHALGTVKRRHLGDQDTSPPERISTERMVGRHVAQVIATCTDELFELVRLGVPRTRISIIPCGVDLTEFQPHGPAAERGAPHRLLAVGRLVPRKGFDLAIDALRGVPDTELVIAGGSPAARLGSDAEATRLSSLARRLGVADQVHLLGQVPRDRMPALFRSADAVVCTPWYEPFGIVPIEAMACGVPVLATPVGGLADTVVDGVTGLHVRAEPAALRRSIQCLIADGYRRDTLGMAGRDRACARYSWDRVAAETTRVYQRVCTEPTQLRTRSTMPTGSELDAQRAGDA
ncbi:MAG TPA: glycosyltransferase [Pseudonocardiaceae bacterium]